MGSMRIAWMPQFLDGAFSCLARRISMWSAVSWDSPTAVMLTR